MPLTVGRLVVCGDRHQQPTIMASEHMLRLLVAVSRNGALQLHFATANRTEPLELRHECPTAEPRSGSRVPSGWPADPGQGAATTEPNARFAAFIHPATLQRRACIFARSPPGCLAALEGSQATRGILTGSRRQAAVKGLSREDRTMLLLIQNMYNRAVLSGDMRLARDLEIRWQRLLDQQQVFKRRSRKYPDHRGRNSRSGVGGGLTLARNGRPE